jgi:hypothetical protein
MVPSCRGVLPTHQEGLGRTFKVDVDSAAHVDDDPVDAAASEAVEPVDQSSAESRMSTLTVTLNG